MHGEAAFADTDAKAKSVSELLAAAINKAPFEPVSRGPSNCGDHQWPSLRGQTSSPTSARPFIDACQTLHHESMIGLILDRMTDVAGLSTDEAQGYIQDVIFPLIVTLAKVAGPISKTEYSLRAVFHPLQEKAVKLRLDWCAAHPNNPVMNTTPAFLEVVVAQGNLDILTTT